jgi:hypothetical protein
MHSVNHLEGAMDIGKVSRNDWIITGGAVLMLIGTLGPWYGISVKLMGQTIVSASVNGWHGSYFGWLTFILCLVAALLVLRRAVSGADFELPFTDAMVATVAGVVSVVIVLLRMVIQPQLAGLRWGIFVSLIAAIAVAVGGFLKNAEPVR